MDEINSNVNKKIPTIGIFVDLKNAFDTVNHVELLKVMERLGFIGAQFDASRTTAHPVMMDGRVLPKSLQITENLICAATAGKKLGYLFRAKKHFSPHDLLTLYKAKIRTTKDTGLSDDSRVGAPKTAVTQENVDTVRKLIIEDRHLTYCEIEASLKISKTSMQKVLHEELGQKAARVNWCQKTLDRFSSGNSKNVYSIVSGDESWIYCYEPENKRQSAVWPTKVSSQSVSKKMVATFVSKAGHIATIPLYEQRTVTADWYTTICSPKVITELRKINPERRIVLHQDNASSHTAQKTRQYLTEENVELLDHPPYKSGLSPNDFFTFSKIKNRLRGERFQSPEEVVDAFENAVLDLPANKWNKCFENWFQRMQMFI
ncbi:unnamed protein product [Acanthoscelides obtectus]|uniref:Transposase n=1 Tax=Acanthoscelides obtectus TaxID=200917 RepID=A0A9P0PIL1_ACAOB|nr:unnamed protein product [Acanthoscelides obtectus]CAK1626472.1 Histone-lysine N-methyltransferase SETMAR [Acanthoscelides obtectus]